MKLVLATPLYEPEHGGPATYAKLLVEGLPIKGVEVTLVKFSDVRGQPKVIRHIAYFFNIVSAARNADLILALDPVSVGFPAALAATFLRKPFVVKVVGDFAWEQGTQRFGIVDTLDQFVQRTITPYPVAFLRMLQQYTARTAKQIIVPSQYLKHIVTTWHIPPDKIVVIYNSIEVPDEYEPVPKEENCIVSVGRLVPWKGMSELIDAVAIVRKRITTAHVHIVGDGPDRELLERKGNYFLGRNIVFAGALSHHKTLTAMESGSIFVLNSTYEGLSHVLIEALTLGCAIIATDAGGNPELITDQENGIIVPSGDVDVLAEELLRLLNDEKLRTRLGAAAKLSSDRFLATTMLTQTEALLRSLV